MSRLFCTFSPQTATTSLPSFTLSWWLPFTKTLEWIRREFSQLSPSCLLIYLYPCPYALSFLMLLWMKCHIPWKRQFFHPFTASHSLNSRMLRRQFSPSLLHHCSPSPSLYIIPISIQSCCYCSHLRKPPLALLSCPATHLPLCPFPAKLYELVVYTSPLQFLSLILSSTHFRQIFTPSTALKLLFFLMSPKAFAFPNQ